MRRASKDGLQSKCKSCTAIEMKEYRQTPKGKAVDRRAAKKYSQTPKGKITVIKARAKYKSGPKSKIAHKRYEQSPKGKATKKQYLKSPEGVAMQARAQKKYEQTPQGRAKSIARVAKRKAIKLQRTPKGLTKEHHKEIEALYIESTERTNKTGIPYDVDHVVPLQGKNVSGMHAPWNLQVITASENRKKGNKF